MTLSASPFERQPWRRWAYAFHLWPLPLCQDVGSLSFFPPSLGAVDDFEFAGFVMSALSHCTSNSFTWAIVWPKSLCLRLGLLASIRCTLTSADNPNSARFTSHSRCRCLWRRCLLRCLPPVDSSLEYCRLQEGVLLPLSLWLPDLACFIRECFCSSSHLFFRATSSICRSYEAD